LQNQAHVVCTWF